MASVFRFDSSGDLLAVGSPDGRIKVWDTRKRTKKCTFDGGTILEGSCSCLAWIRATGAQEDATKSKRRRRLADASRSLFIAAGSSGGRVTLWDVVSGENERTLEAHQSRVNDFAWDESQCALITCSDDHFIAKWNVETWEEIARWKGDTGPVTALCADFNGTTSLLLSAGRKIKLWDSVKRELLKKFTGHANYVRYLQFVPGYKDYFISLAENERVINAWSSSIRTCVATFSCTEEVAQVHVEKHSVQRDLICLAALSKTSTIHVFTHSLNGSGKAPLDPTCTIQITNTSSMSDPTPVDVWSARLVSGGASLVLAYGSLALPTFEKINPIQEDSHVCLCREVDLGSSSKRLSQKRKSSAGPSTLIGPAQTVMPGTVADGDGERIADEVTVEERLKSVTFTGQSDGHATADSQAQMLVQALYSEDHALLENVLRVGKHRVIETTVKRLPSTLIVPFIEQLVQRIEKKPTRAGELVSWIKTVLLVHGSYLMTVPNLKESLGVLYSLLKSRSILFPQLCVLQGRLDVMVSQLKMQHGSKDDFSNFEPLAVYSEESDEEVSAEMGVSYEEEEDSIEDENDPE